MNDLDLATRILVILAVLLIGFVLKEWQEMTDPSEKGGDTCDNEAYCTCGKCFMTPYH